jgi:hypothetical protein
MARKAIAFLLPALVDLLDSHLDSLWIKSPKLFNNKTLSDNPHWVFEGALE